MLITATPIPGLSELRGVVIMTANPSESWGGMQTNLLPTTSDLGAGLKPAPGDSDSALAQTQELLISHLSDLQQHFEGLLASCAACSEKKLAKSVQKLLVWKKAEVAAGYSLS